MTRKRELRKQSSNSKVKEAKSTFNDKPKKVRAQLPFKAAGSERDNCKLM